MSKWLLWLELPEDLLPVSVTQDGRVLTCFNAVMILFIDFSAFQNAKVVITVLVAKRRVSHVQTMRFVISRQESARGPVFVLLALLVKIVRIVSILTNELCGEKTCLRGFRPGPTQKGLYSHRRWIIKGMKILDLDSREIILSIHGKQGGGIKCGYCAADLRICFFTYAKIKFSHDAAQLLKNNPKYCDNLGGFIVHSTEICPKDALGKVNVKKVPQRRCRHNDKP